ncbi:MAG: hypothetical protein PQJ59_06220 [Spirochaetales bacterium]|nr:hypothetical protein [Spirochaetales bacterium]
MVQGSFHKSPAAKFLNFLFILPLFLGLRPLFINYRLLDTLVFLGGMALILGLIIYNNSIAYITYDEVALRVLLPYRENREEHRFENMLGYRKKGSRQLTLFSLDHKPLRIILKPSDMERFIDLLIQEGISETSLAGGRGK